jgi:hypothetical protein
MSGFIDKLYERLKVAFPGRQGFEVEQAAQVEPPRVEQSMVELSRVEHALELLRYLALWSGQVKTLARASLELCETILISTADEDLKWDAARLVIQIGFRNRKNRIYYLSAGAHSNLVCLTFLEYHLANDPHNHESIADAFHTMALYDYYIPYDLSRGCLAQGICLALEDPSHRRLYRAALRFAHKIASLIGDPANRAIQQVFIQNHGFCAGLKAAWKDVVLANDRTDLDVDTEGYLEILGELSKSRLWHPYLLENCLDTFEYATLSHRNWLDSLLTGNHARKIFRWEAFARFIRIVWQNGLCLPGEYHEIVHFTVNLLVMKGKPVARDLANVVNHALKELEEDLKKLQPGKKHNDLKLVVRVQTELMKFLEDVTPNGWDDIMSSNAKARRGKFVQRMQRRWPRGGNGFFE